MDCITPTLIAAMDSLTGRYNKTGIDEWDKVTRFIHDDKDWRLIEINRFRERMKTAETMRTSVDINRIRGELKKRNLTSTEEKTAYLYRMGMGGNTIRMIIPNCKSDVEHAIAQIRSQSGMTKHNKNSIALSDALAMIKSGMADRMQ